MPRLSYSDGAHVEQLAEVGQVAVGGEAREEAAVGGDGYQDELAHVLLPREGGGLEDRTLSPISDAQALHGVGSLRMMPCLSFIAAKLPCRSVSLSGR